MSRVLLAARCAAHVGAVRIARTPAPPLPGAARYHEGNLSRRVSSAGKGRWIAEMLATGEPIPQRTRVGIIGAGPAGLLLSHLLALQGIESVVLERRSRAHVERRIRAGVIEDGTRAILERAGVGERMAREGLRHRGINLAFEGRLHAIDLATLTGGRGITVYGQQEVVKDLIAARLRAGGAIAFEAEAVDVEASDSPSPAIVYQTRSGQRGRLACDFVAGCDGSHGIAREAIPAGTLHVAAQPTWRARMGARHPFRHAERGAGVVPWASLLAMALPLTALAGPAPG